MATHQYLTAPIRTSGMPPGVPYIIGNEAAERFSAMAPSQMPQA
ncbi:MAG: POT family MFS transporter [Verrucomicrobia bacterium]|nr:POT family MFS transporter [Verrucomicrobiota bacterium]